MESLNSYIHTYIGYTDTQANMQYGVVSRHMYVHYEYTLEIEDVFKLFLLINVNWDTFTMFLPSAKLLPR